MPKLVSDRPRMKLAPLNMRTTEALRARLEQAAVAGHRSLTAEVEFRLAESFQQDDLRTLIREEIRAALAERDEAQPDVDGFVRVTPRSGFLYRY